MIFGKIDYVNLLPFYVFLKRRLKSSAQKAALLHKKGVPSAVNRQFANRRIDGAFISSIKSKGKRCTCAGIVADGPVLSVLLLPGKKEKDAASDTSNKLAELLGLEGKVLIGDPALKAWFSGVEAVDLAEEWQRRTGLPFVFARLCYNGNREFFEPLAREFVGVRPKIPHYIMNRYVLRTGLSREQLLFYLEHIHYRIDARAEKGLKKFLSVTSP